MDQAAIYQTLTPEQFFYLMLGALVVMWVAFGTFSVRWCCSLVNGVRSLLCRPRGDKPRLPTTEKATMVIKPLSPEEVALCRKWNQYEQSLILLPRPVQAFGIVLINALLFALAGVGVWWYLYVMQSAGKPLTPLQIGGLVLGGFLFGPCAAVAVNRQILGTSWLNALAISMGYAASTVMLTLFVLVTLKAVTDIWR